MRMVLPAIGVDGAPGARRSSASGRSLGDDLLQRPLKVPRLEGFLQGGRSSPVRIVTKRPVTGREQERDATLLENLGDRIASPSREVHIEDSNVDGLLAGRLLGLL